MSKNLSTWFMDAPLNEHCCYVTNVIHLMYDIFVSCHVVIINESNKIMHFRFDFFVYSYFLIKKVPIPKYSVIMVVILI